MNAKIRRCQGVKLSGDPCAAPSKLVGDDGYCTAHRPGGRAEMARRGTKGAYSKGKKGLKPDELGPLETPQDAARWLERIGRAVTTGRLANREADAATRAVKVWLAAWDSGQVADELVRLKQQVRELQGKKLKRIK